jgi:hypothetical protein
MEISLDELKAQNLAEEAALDVPSDKGNEDEYVEVVENTNKDDVEGDDNKEPEAELESWQQTEEAVDSEEDDKSKGFRPNHEAKSRRLKAKALRGELKEKDDELETLRAENLAFRNGNSQPVTNEPKKLTRPTREQFDFDDDKYDEATEVYFTLMMDEKLSNHNSKSTQATQANEHQAKLDKRFQTNFDQHYEEAQQLIDDGKITGDSFKGAESVVIQALDNHNPGNGQKIFDTLVLSLGKDSAKVAFQLGVNPAMLH